MIYSTYAEARMSSHPAQSFELTNHKSLTCTYTLTLLMDNVPRVQHN